MYHHFFPSKSTAIVTSICLMAISGFSQKTSLSYDKKIDSIIAKMTLEEKIGQMSQVTLDVLGDNKDGKGFRLNDSIMSEVLLKYKVGSVLNTSENRAMSIKKWNEIINAIQQKSIQNKSGIPVIYGFDAIHGATYVQESTLFPQQIGMSATWNRDLVRAGASISAYESRAASVLWNFSPVLDLGINPVWPRFWETFGEDPYLVSQMGIETIKGYQQNNNNNNVIACLKHFLAYSDPKNGKDRTNAWLPEHYIREYHLPSFKAALDAGARTVMVNSSTINGVPTHMNGSILNGLLKKELGFTGMVVTDWQDIDNIYKRDKVATDRNEAIMLAINAGIDMAMIPYDYKEFCQGLTELVKEGKVSVSRINDAVKRVLRIKFEAGLFANSNNQSGNYEKAGSVEFQNTSFNAAAESITLLKNDNNILPLKSGSRILVTGPNANSVRTLNGGWSYSWQGEKTEEFAGIFETILEAAQSEFGSSNVSFAEGVAYKMNGKYFEDSVVDLDKVTTAAMNVDYILLCIGENSYTEKPGDINDLSLSPNQLLLAQKLIETGKPIILVLNEGRPRIISNIERNMTAVLQTYLPGNMGGTALAGILSGKVNPSGKLPYTYPRYVNALTNYIHKYADEQVNPQGAYDYSADYNPQYPFGFGLSYTSFSYADLKVENIADNMLKVSVMVKNTGSREGKESVQVYVSDCVASLAPDVRRLRAFDKLNLKPGEEKLVSFNIPIKELAFVNLQQQKVVEKGKFTVTLGQLSKDFMVGKNLKF